MRKEGREKPKQWSKKYPVQGKQVLAQFTSQTKIVLAGYFHHKKTREGQLDPTIC
jgi:hypothetical protein